MIHYNFNKYFVFLCLTIFSQQAIANESFILPKSFNLENNLPKIEQKENEAINNKKEIPDAVSKVQPKQSISIINMIKTFKSGYSETLKSTIATLTQYKITPLSYDSDKGQINAKLSNGSELFIILLPSTQKITHVRITPADGNYKILSTELIKNIFHSIEDNLYTQDVNS